MTEIAPPDPLAPIGVFDSGLGGLTVVKCLTGLLPAEKIVYVADQIHVPYGGRELEVVRQFACGISQALIRVGCKAIVMACNISSAIALSSVQSSYPDVPVLGVITPGAEAALEQSRSGRIGVLATVGTVQSAAYTRTLQALDPRIIVTESACPQFVPLVESGAIDSIEAARAAALYLAPLRHARVDVAILGCTHYPFLLPVLTGHGQGIQFVDPAEHTARKLKDVLETHDLLSSSDVRPRHLFATSGDPRQFAAQLNRFVPEYAAFGDIGQARWQSNELVLPRLQ